MLLAVSLAPAAAATTTWTGAGGDNAWKNAANWSNGAASNALVEVFDGTGAAYLTPTVMDGDSYCQEINFKAGAAAYTIMGGAGVGNATLKWYTTGAGADATYLLIDSGVTEDQTFTVPFLMMRANAGKFTNNGTGTLRINSTMTVNPSMTVATTLVFDGTGNSIINGNIASTGIYARHVTKAGAGSLTLAGNNGYAGTTSVTGGKLLVNGTIAAGGNVSVDSGAILAGNGTINSAASVAGTLSAGDVGTVGELNIRSSLAVTGNVIFDVDSGGYDQIKGLTSLDITGATISLVLAEGFTPVAGTTLSLFNVAAPGAHTFIAPDLSSQQLVWIDNLANNGTVTLQAVPESSGLGLVTVASFALLMRRRSSSGRSGLWKLV